MKVRESIKHYVIAIAIIVGILFSILIGSYSTYNLYTGMEIVTKGIMQIKAETEAPQDGMLVVDRPFYIASKWYDLPLVFQLNFDIEELVHGEVKQKSINVKSKKGNYTEIKLFLGKFQAGDSERLVGIKINDAALDDFADSLDLNLEQYIKYTLALIFVLMLIFSFGLLYIIRKVAKPIEELKDWVLHGRDRSNKNNIPDFKFQELNLLAKVLSSSLAAVYKSVRKERDFIRYASHELRTPIAVIRSNSELMRKMMEKDLPKERLYKNIERIENNSLSMSDLCETLLWLNREKSNDLVKTEVSLGVLAETVVNELRYLLEGKDIAVEINVEGTTHLNFEGMCKLVISNLVRNAFQHTDSGRVIIKQSGEQISIINVCYNCGEVSEHTGFGLGLILVEKICHKHHWQYDEIVIEQGRHVTVRFG
ncbi:sensor histidine kinase [Vibrio campbellii]|uniref:sensor histidine kinase n=1 Tax=Vibrio campbellii TaxID=680 RepID=UPI003736FA0F